MNLTSFPLPLLAVATLVLGAVAPRTAHAEKIRDVAEVAGARENQLVGYGIVTGLAGTGDDVSAPFAQQSTLALLRRLGVQADAKQVRLKNVAAVIVTATLPSFSKPGTKIDITVSSIGNARSISGGTLLQALLKGADQKTYAVAQGNITVGGFEAKGGSGSSVKQGSTTAGRIPEGAIVEHDVPTSVVNGGEIRLDLRTPGFSAAAAVAEAVDKRLGVGSARAADGGTIVVKVPAEYTDKPVELIAALEEIDVTMVRKARVVINERTGTIVAGGDVRLKPVAIVHGSLTIVVKETPVVSQPGAPVIGAAAGKTVVTKQSEVSATEAQRPVAYMAGAPTLADMAKTLGSLGLSPRELTGVFGALRAAGALEAEVVTQ